MFIGWLKLYGLLPDWCLTPSTCRRLVRCSWFLLLLLCSLDVVVWLPLSLFEVYERSTFSLFGRRCSAEADVRLPDPPACAAPTIYLSLLNYWSDHPPPAMSYKSRPFKWTWCFVFWSEQFGWWRGGGFGVLVRAWCASLGHERTHR